MKATLLISNLFLFAAIAMFCNSCDQSEDSVYVKKSFQHLKNLNGKWLSINSEATFTQTWEILNDTLLESKMYKINNADTIQINSIRIYYTGKEIIHQVYIKAKEGKPERYYNYKLIGTQDSSAVFYTSEIPYPSSATYVFTPNDGLIIKFSGTKDGKEISDEYAFVRYK